MSTMPIGPNDPNFKYLTPIEQRMALAAQGAPLPTVEDFIRGLGQQGGDPFSQTPQGINALPGQSPVAPPPVDPAMGMPGPVAGPTPEQAGMVPQAGGPPANFAVVDDYIDSGDNARDIYSEQNPEPKKKLGLFGRIRQQPGGSRALLALGASLLSNQNFFTGLGQGAMAYQTVLDEEKEKLKPKRSFIAGGAFQVVQNADGTTTIERTPVADYEQQNLGTKLETQIRIGENRNETSRENNRDTNETKIREAQITADAAWDRLDADLKFKREQLEEETRRAIRVAEIGKANGNGKAPDVKAIEGWKQAKLDTSNADYSLRGINQSLEDINSGVLDLSLANNAFSKVRTTIGGAATNDYDKARQRLQSTVQRAVRSILSSNVGVQTQMDAERAEREILSSSSSPELVKDALGRLRSALLELKSGYADTISEYESAYDFGGRGGSSTPRSGKTSTGVSWRVVE